MLKWKDVWNVWYAEKMSLYDIVSKKNHQIIIYAYACIIISQLKMLPWINYLKFFASFKYIRNILENSINYLLAWTILFLVWTILFLVGSKIKQV